MLGREFLSAAILTVSCSVKGVETSVQKESSESELLEIFVLLLFKQGGIVVLQVARDLLCFLVKILDM